MKKAILMAIKPQYLFKILNGEKTIEIRKTIPNCELPIDVYLYCTKEKNEFDKLEKQDGEYYYGDPCYTGWENYFIKKYNIQLCKLYYSPYNFTRTGCKGCPFALDLQHVLDVMSELLPAERKQCEEIWKPIYSEYRRINFRLTRTLFDIKFEK